MSDEGVRIGGATCGTCPFFTPVRSQHRQGAGACHRFPQPVAKDVEGLCGEHPALAAERNHALALVLADVVSASASWGEPGSLPPAGDDKKGARHG